MLPVAHGDVLLVGASRNVKSGCDAEANYEKVTRSPTQREHRPSRQARPKRRSRTRLTSTVMVLRNLASRS